MKDSASITLYQERTCDECGKSFDAKVMHKCYSPDEDSPDGETVVYLCPDCNNGIWYCMGCGVFCAGITSFEFGPLKGYCDNCQDEIESNMRDEDEESDYFDEF